MQRKLLFLSLFLSFFFLKSEQASSDSIYFQAYSFQESLTLLKENNVNLEETLFVLDFDETVAQRVVDYDGQFYELICSAELERTYMKVAKMAMVDFEMYRALCGIFASIKALRYRILDPTLHEFLEVLSSSGIPFVICSGLQITPTKKEFLKEIQFDERHYYCQNGAKNKALTIKLHFNKMRQGKGTIRNIVLIDNSYFYAIDPYFYELEENPLKAWVDENWSPQENMKIIGIELKAFENKLTAEALHEEGKKLDALAKN